MIDVIVLDIETTDLYADVGAVLCMSWESSREPGVVHTIRNDFINRKAWRAGRRGDDRELVKQCNAQVRSHQIVAAHNGRWFDIPFLRTRAIANGLAPLNDMPIVDPLRIARNKFRFHRNALGSLSDLMGLADHKTPLDLSTWREARLNGSTEAMDAIVEHCEKDVRVLSGVLDHVKPFIRQFDAMGSDR